MLLRRAAAVAVSIGVYLVAYWHGRTTRGSAVCPACRTGPEETAALEEAETLQTLMPHTERRMVECILKASEARNALRQRLHVCLRESGAIAAAPPPASLPPARVAPPVLARPPPVAVRLDASSPLVQQIAAARQAEESLVSSPIAPAASEEAEAALPGPPAAVTEAAEAAGAKGLTLITCLANDRFLATDAAAGGDAKTPWISCSGDASGPLESGLFAPKALSSGQIAFLHVLTGRYLQVVPPGGGKSDPTWVVRLASTDVGPPEMFEEETVGGHTYLFNRRCGCHLNHRFDTIVRGHAEGGKPAGQIESARLSLVAYDSARLRTAYREAARGLIADRRPLQLQMSTIASLAASNEVRVIAYGLYGKDARYTIGVLRNAELAPAVYPGWKVRVYHDASVPSDVLSTLRQLGAELVDMQDRQMGGGIGGMFWRFLVAADPTVDRFIVRDSDSRLNPRERLAVEEWVASGLKIHSIRDHPNHDRPLNGGMWGGLRGVVADMAEIVQQWSNRDRYMGDLDFLNKKVWPRPEVSGSQMAHDAYSCKKYPNSRPFPTRRPPDLQHVGQVFFGDGKPRMGDLSFIRNQKAPMQCRLKRSWTNG